MEQATAIDEHHVEHIRALLSANPEWHRSHLSVELCKLWGWQSPSGQYKDMACRSLLLKLERAGAIILPPRQGKHTFISPPSYPSVPHQTEEIGDQLKALLPLQIITADQDRSEYKLFNCLLSQYHYLSYRGAVGENLKYLIRDVQGRPLACLLYGSAAWKTAPRDACIGWTPKDREGNLRYLTNNMRFLILPWVRVPIWPAISSPGSPVVSAPTGIKSMVIQSICWKHLLIAHCSGASVIRRQTGCLPARPRVVPAMIGIMTSRRRSRTSTSIP